MTPDTSDEEWVRRATKGDRRGYSTLVHRYARRLAQAARGFGLPETDVDDVVQETFVSAWRNLGLYDPSLPFRPWLFRIATNKMRDHRRRRSVRSFLFGASDIDEGLRIADDAPNPEQTMIAVLDLARIKATLNLLETPLREALVLTALVGLSQSEAAQSLNVSVKAVETRVARARRKLARLIELEKTTLP
ncbi:RNA polymerase sigma factor cnrH [Novosphingobium sp. Rr 2-17]|uniref:RNA polymerase sigma factor n=1 Tax=Novosphingobium sp. Rr 2-17 TaxID=555793 RepID=UPI000269817B|nr:RNA polymerase sigma factor [Novosphingobium sp. Rr 2-17]EIZ81251.1 RNA polymerase sigma factor cnrH [Novosphingobium sp. Rr 2-17]